MKIIPHAEIQTSNWKGGQTSEIFIYPENSNYKNLNFSFRISEATIEEKHSIFTPLPNVRRQLMVLSGSLNLIHRNHYDKILNPLESDCFNGNWHTESRGFSHNFNLMMLGQTDGYLEALTTKSPENLVISTDCDLVCLYVLNGGIHFNDKTLSTSDTLVLEKPDRETKINALAKSQIIITRIWFN